MEPKKHKQIKTIAQKLNTTQNTDFHTDKFDRAVNEALRDGWFLDKRYTLPARTEDKYSMLIAELQRFENE